MIDQSKYRHFVSSATSFKYASVNLELSEREPNNVAEISISARNMREEPVRKFGGGGQGRFNQDERSEQNSRRRLDRGLLQPETRPHQ